MSNASANFARHRRNLLQFIRFGIVGSSGVVVNMAVTVVMTKLHGGGHHDNDPLFWITSKFAFRFTLLVWIVAFFVANFFNFQLNRSWTFKREHRRSWWAEFWPFFLVGSIAAAIGAIIKVLLTNSGSPLFLGWGYLDNSSGLRTRAYWAQLIAIILTLPVNFVVNKLWTFRAVQHHVPGADDLPMVAPVVDPDEVADTGELLVDDIMRAGHPQQDGPAARA